MLPAPVGLRRELNVNFVGGLGDKTKGSRVLNVSGSNVSKHILTHDLLLDAIRDNGARVLLSSRHYKSREARGKGTFHGQIRGLRIVLAHSQLTLEIVTSVFVQCFVA